MVEKRKAPRNSAVGRLRIVSGLCILLGIAGVVYAVFWGAAADGSRGGALAVALTFFMLFLDRGTAKDLLEADLPASQQVGEIPCSDAELTTYLAKLATEDTKDRNALAAMLDWQDEQKVPLALSSVTGTIFWGFGDVFARWFSAA